MMEAAAVAGQVCSWLVLLDLHPVSENNYYHEK